MQTQTIFPSTMHIGFRAATPALSPLQPSTSTEAISLDGASAILQRIIHALEVDHIYRDNNLSLGTFADHVKVSTRMLHMVLELMVQKNYHDIINEYRVADFMRRASNPKYSHYTLLGLALESGFNSKSTFNSVFKRLMGMTPKVYFRMAQQAA